MQRTIEHQSWVDFLGAKKCAKIEAKVDKFLAKHPSPDEYDGDGRIFIPKDGSTRGDRHMAWHSDIRDLVKDEDGGIYALRYACNEWVFLPMPTAKERVLGFAWKCRRKVRGAYFSFKYLTRKVSPKLESYMPTLQEWDDPFWKRVFKKSKPNSDTKPTACFADFTF